MLFNTRGLAVSTSTVAVAAGAGYFFARAALDKLAFIATTLSTKGIEAGVLLELICDLRHKRVTSPIAACSLHTGSPMCLPRCLGASAPAVGLPLTGVGSAWGALGLALTGV